MAIVPLIFIFFSLPGIVYGYAAGTFKSSSDVIKSMEEVMKMLLGFMVFAFFAAQFLYVFGKSGIGTLLAISGAEFLKDLGMPSAGLAAGHHHLHRHAQPSHHLGDLQVGDPFDHLRPDADDARHLA